MGCHNGTYHLRQWQKKKCEMHNSSNGRGQCLCPPPFVLFPFPSENNMDKRNIWVANVGRVETVDRVLKSPGGPIHRKKNDRWQPSSYDRICSDHFVDGKPTDLNPYPVLKMGHNSSSLKRKVRKPPTQRQFPLPKRKKDITLTPSQNVCDSNMEDNTKSQENTQDNVVNDHCYSVNCCVGSCAECVCCRKKEKTNIDNLNLISNLLEKIETLESQLEQEKNKNSDIHKQLHEVINERSKSKADEMLETCLSSDKNVKFYTGLPSKAHFELLHEYL